MKKKIISIITIMLITGSLVMNTYASNLTNVTEFTDYDTLQSHWGLNDINILVSRGGIKGIPNNDGTFRFEPDREITTAELLSLILNTSGNAPTSTDWPMNVMDKAKSLGLISSEWCNEDIANGAIPRERMASILYNTATKLLREDINSSDYDVDPEKVGDIVGNEYKFEIKGVYDFGLIAGDETGKFNPTGNTTRAESCAIINRLFKYTERVDNSRLEYGNETPSSSGDVWITPGIGCHGAITDYPREGDMFNGQPITRDPETGVLGFGNGQKGGIYLGVQVGNKDWYLEVNSECPEDLPCQEPLAKTYYTKKGDYVYWDDEWLMIEKAGLEKLRAEHIDAPEGTCADIYGNILEGVTDPNNKDVFFVMGDSVTDWMCAKR